MTATPDETLAENVESLAFVDRAIRIDREKFMDLSKKVNELIEAMQQSGANPVTIYYITRALDDYAADKLEAFGKVVEDNKAPESEISSERIRVACEQLFALALEDAAKMTTEEQKKLLEEQAAEQKKKHGKLAGYA
jgi:hypothetical protein